MTAPHEISDRVSGRQNGMRIDAWALCAEFIEWVVADARARAGNDSPEDLSDVDWASIWRAGDGASSDEMAIGRIVRAASETARGASLERSQPAITPHLGDDGPSDDAPGGAVLSQTRDVAEDLQALTGLSAVSKESVVVHPDPIVAQAEVADVTEFKTTVADPVALQVVVTPDRGETLTVEPPESSTTEQIGTVQTTHVPIVVPAPAPYETISVQPDHKPGKIEFGTPTHSAWYHVFTWMRNIGVILLLFVVWQLWGTAIAQHHAQNQLRSQFEAELRLRHPPVPVKPGSLIPASTRFAAAADGSVLARLQIPAIGVDQYVVEGTNSNDLAKGPGHYVGTALPGQAGNVAIAGHRTTHGAPFNELGHVTPGDRIILTTSWGEHLTYTASGSPQVVSPTDVGVLNYFDDNRITLTTCNPEFSSSQRLIVVGKLDQHVSTPKSTAPVIYHVDNSNTSSWNFSLLPDIGLEVGLLLLLGMSYRFFGVWFDSVTRWFILIPLWAAGLYLLFGTVTVFLPSSI